MEVGYQTSSAYTAAREILAPASHFTDESIQKCRYIFLAELLHGLKEQVPNEPLE
jgi:hypothetical protein